MKLLCVALLSAIPALPQVTPQAPTVDPKCAGAPDGIFGKNKGIYYGCLQGKEVRSSTTGAMPANWIADYDAKIRAFDAQMAPYKTKRASRSVTQPTKKSAKRQSAPLAEELVNSIPLGSTRTDVVGQLGEPYMKISGDTERLTYRLTSGNLARLDFDNGKLAQIRIANN